ncbi:MAG: sulfotransferase family 2 domain-containing protein [Cyanobacteria bacterium J06639_14]
MSSHRLFFIHIPKTAGTTFNAFLEQQYDLGAIIPPGFFGKHEVYVRPEDIEAHRDQLKQFALLRGHFGYKIYQAMAPEFITLTVLRHPLERVVSLYNDWRTKSEENLENAPELEKSLAMLAQHLSLPDFLQASHAQLPHWFHNGQARLLAQDFSCELEDAELQRLALEHLDAIDYVGITEAFDLFLWVLCERFGWYRPVQLQALNKARHSLRVEDLDEAARAIVAEKNAVDWALYHRAQKRALTTANQALQAPCHSKWHLDRRDQVATVITMADALPGRGWHVREGVPSDRLWRWTGPTLETSLFIRLDRRRYRLSIRVISVIDASILYQSEIRVNGTTIATTIQNDAGDFLLEGDIPKKLISDRVPTKLAIVVPRTMAPTDVDPDATDSRQKGLAIQEISLQPTSRKLWSVTDWQ